MKVLIIEDNANKLHDIKNTLENLSITDIDAYPARNPGLNALHQSYADDEPYDLLILDMWFPIFENGMPQSNAGIGVLHEIERKGWDIPVIVCSSDETDCADIFENVIADITYSPFVSMNYAFTEALGELRKD